MSDYFNVTGTIGFTCDVCGRELQGCTWVNGMRFCAKCYQETFGNTNPFEKELRDKIADLEAKLAEKEQELNDLCQNYDFQLNDFSREVYRLQQREKSLQEQLAEKEKEIEEMHKQLSYCESLLLRECKECDNQYKISFAVEQLEKVKELCIKDMTICEDYFAIEKILDQQIKELKEKK